jgi:2'-5' RNA ligase
MAADNAVRQGLSAGRRRVFFALWPDASVQARLAEAAGLLHRITNGRLTPAANIHLTLAFVGAVGVERLALLLAPPAELVSRAFVLTLDECGCWTHNGIVWAAPAQVPDALAVLAANLERWLRDAHFELEVRPFSPHLTLIRHAQCAQLTRSMSPVEWLVGKFSLVESRLMANGSVYRTLGTWPLAQSQSRCPGDDQR